MKIYRHPKSLLRSDAFSVSVNDMPIEVLATGVAHFAVLAFEPADFPARIEVHTASAEPSATIHPTAKGIRGELNGTTFEFTLERPEKISVKFAQLPALYIFGNPPEADPPDPADPLVVAMQPGQVFETPLLTLEDNQTLYLPGGSVLKARVHVKGKTGIRICGHGIFDGSFYDRATDGAIPSIILERCPDVLVEDITMVRPCGWMLLLGACKGATVRNLKQIGEVMSSDGVDVVGSSDVLIEDCFLHNNDDCVVIKAFEVGGKNLSATHVDARENVENVLVRNCTFANWTAGNAMEIGHELAVDLVRNIIFRNIDVLHVHGTGAVFSIHNNDHARVEDVLFEDIRIEHCYDKLIDFRVSESRYSTDRERGSMRNITLRNIFWDRHPVNLGYTISVIGGWDADHTIESVLIENFIISGKRLEHLDELEINSRHAHRLNLI